MNAAQRNARLFIVNPTDRDWTHQRFILWFDQHAPLRLLVFATHLEDALDECVGWLEDHAPGQFCDDAVSEDYEACLAQGMDEDAAREHAEMDMTICDCGHYLASWEWGIWSENPTRAEIKELLDGEPAAFCG